MRLNQPQGIHFDWIPKKPFTSTFPASVDYYELFKHLRLSSKHSYFLESLALPRHQDRYYSMGFDPSVIFYASGQTLSLEGQAEVVSQCLGQNPQGQTMGQFALEGVNPYALLMNAWTVEGLGSTHQGGLVGYFSYEAVNLMEPSLNLEEDPDFGLFQLGLYLDGILYDSTTNEFTYYAYTNKADFQNKLQQLVANIDAMQGQPKIKPVLETVAFQGYSETNEEFKTAVANTQIKIAQGYSFQAEVGFKSRYEIHGDKLAVYERLREVNPSPYMFYVQFDDRILQGASPEILLSANNRLLLTTPTAGTTHRGKTAEEDALLGRGLLTDPKEIAEHNMLVDLHRNDLARVSIPGSVLVTDLMYLIKFSHVQHIVSNVIGLLQTDKNAFHALASLFPGGVVTGAPKIETIKIIDANEHLPRGPYGGAVGRMSLNGDAAFCLSIRSLFSKGSKSFVQTSAGVVFDSKPDKEFQEVCNKLAAMKQVLEELGGCHE